MDQFLFLRNTLYARRPTYNSIYYEGNNYNCSNSLLEWLLHKLLMNGGYDTLLFADDFFHLDGNPQRNVGVACYLYFFGIISWLPQWGSQPLLWRFPFVKLALLNAVSFFWKRSHCDQWLLPPFNNISEKSPLKRSQVTTCTRTKHIDWGCWKAIYGSKSPMNGNVSPKRRIVINRTRAIR